MKPRWRTLWGAASGLLTALPLAAQSPAPQKVFTNKTLFTVPLKIADADRAKINGLKCYVKGPDGVWQLHESASAETSKFTYQAAADGEYQFAFATVDAAGRENPARPDLDGPKLFVVVDTQPPEFTATGVPVASGAAYVQCLMRDVNADPATVTAEAEAADGSFVPLLPHDKERPGIFQAPHGIPARVRISGKDRAGNAAVQIVSLGAPARNEAVAAAPAGTGVPGVRPIAAPSLQSPTAAAPIIVPPNANTPPAPLPVAATPPTTTALTAPPLAAAPITGGTGLASPSTPLAAPAPVLPPPAVPTSVAAPVPALPAPTPAVPEPLLPRVAEKPVDPATTAAATGMLVNAPRVALNFAVDELAGQPVRKVEAYAMHEDGRRWMKLSEHPGQTSPIELTLPGEGRWGILLMVNAGPRPVSPPTPGDQPDTWIEVDATPPTVLIENATPGVGPEAGLLLLQWSVRDKNVKPDAVDAYWAQQPEGPWQPIAKNLRADGQYRWPIPREAGARVFIKVEATDRAGNTGKAVTPQPVVLETARPRVRVLGINPAAVRQ